MTAEPPEGKGIKARPPSPEELTAYHDGEASPELCRAIESWLADHPGSAEILDDWRALDAGLRAELEAVPAEPLPGRLRAALAPRPLFPYLQAVAAAALLFLAASSGWFARGAFEPAGFPLEALRAHAVYAVEQRHPVEVDASQTAHLERWLSKRTGLAIAAPSLEQHGYLLMGGRLLSSSAGPAALLMYEDGQSNRVSLIVARQAEQETVESLTLKDARSTGLFWQGGDALFAVIGSADEALLRRLGASVTPQNDGI